MHMAKIAILDVDLCMIYWYFKPTMMYIVCVTTQDTLLHTVYMYTID